MMPGRISPIGITAASFSLLLFVQACSKPEEKEPQAVVQVQTAAVERTSIQRIIQAQAILHPADQAAITPKISAPIRQFYVNRGDHVRKGQLLAQLENRDLEAATTEAKGNYDQAQANYRNTTAASLPDEIVKSQAEVQSAKEALDAAQRVYESRKKLFEQGALARRQLDEAQLAYVQARDQYEVASRHLQSLQQTGKEAQTRAAQAQVEAARGHHQAAEVQLQYSRIYSPINGVVTDRPLYPGEMASSSAALVTVMDLSRVIARASVPINELRYLKTGNSATIKAPETSIETSGKVTVVSPALDPNSTTAEVWISAPNPGERLRPGSTVQVAIVAETIRDALVIPAAAILPSEQSAGGMVLIAGADSLAHERRIETGVREGDRVQVLKGLSAGEQVITNGFGIQDKSRVTTSSKQEESKKED
jgi:multidrug efflux pump subunit AcrA (membrane-fusion protein)